MGVQALYETDSEAEAAKEAFNGLGCKHEREAELMADLQSPECERCSRTLLIRRKNPLGMILWARNGRLGSSEG